MEKLLPRDITLQVFIRLPIQSILHCMLVCKAWLNILKDPCFPLQHVLYRVHGGGDNYGHDHGFLVSVMLLYDFFSVRDLLFYQEYDENRMGFYLPPFKRISMPGNPTVDYYHDYTKIIIGSCNGLICCGVLNDGDPIYICNPITREYLWLPKSTTDSYLCAAGRGFGYHHSTNEYKVVRFSRKYKVAAERVQVQVYTLGGTSDDEGWRDKDDISYQFISKGIFVNGEIYWLCDDYRTSVAFNVADETYREFISLPPCMTNCGIRVYLFELDGCLCVVEQSVYHKKNDVWLLRKTSAGNDVNGHHTWSWNREFSVPINVLNHPFITPLIITKSGGLLLWHGNEYLCFYDPKHGIMQHVGHSINIRSSSTDRAIPHVNSLVSLKALVGERPDWKNRKLSVSKPNEGSNIVSQLLRVVMTRLSQTMDIQIISVNDREKQQAVLCDVLQEFIHTLSASDDTKVHIFQSLDEIMMLLLRVFGYGSSIARQKVMLSIRALVYATGPEFGKCMPILDKYLGMGLQNVRDYQVFAVTVEVVGDICRALDEKILPFCDGIMSHLLADLSSGVTHPSATPLIFSCFGDIGIAIGKHFEKYLPYVMPMIQVASEICAEMDTANEAMMNYRNQLMSGIFDAYSGILQGLKNLKSELMLPYAGHLLQVIKLVIKEKTRQESVSKAAVAAMGDLAHTLGPNVKLLFKDRALYADFLRECLDSDDYKMKEIATWTQRTMKHGFVCERPACR